MAAITRLFHEINDVTGFANGDTFDTRAQVLEYFTVENLHGMVGAEQFRSPEGNDLTPTQGQLDRWAEVIIENRWHCSADFHD